MSRREEIENKTEALLKPIVEKNEVRIYDVEFVKEAGQWYLRAYIDRDGGVDINKCVDVSHELSDALDEHDFIDEEYILEVSSPGLGRALKKDRHFENSLGQEVDVKLYKAQDGTKEFTGNLKSYDSDTITIETPTGDKTFIRKEVSSVKLTLDF
ncbi:ribosome maturation factor RimP [Butyrivibrio sp. INlla16]|uniref:ribosome maturation factor RimP n=1 Tax=Butyrivibrio sp. INlla16 TaxID=1520807 RepID=UPI0008881C1A|nr:ribosome maturation factor RimP [Butyrivibrio sp. INlla16]SDB59005.1 ribosome maturation factor RimP [Butyrivibrio sp. INlla16]